MKKGLLLSATLIFFSFSLFPQSAGFLIKDGMTVQILNRTWENNLLKDPKYLKATQEVKEELVAARNEEINSGKTEAYRLLVKHKITKEEAPPGMNRLKSSANIIGREEASYLNITNDTFYLDRSNGLKIKEAGGENQGFTYLGVEKIPFNIKLGDVPLVYEDLEVSYPKTKNAVIKEKVAAVNRSSALSEVIDPEVLQTATVTSQTFYNVDGKVGRIDEIVINYKKYSAFVIESETWTKKNLNETYASSRIETTKAEGKIDRKLLVKAGKNTPKLPNTNEAGYVVTYREVFFVPELGIARTRYYDSSFALVNESVIFIF